MRLFVAVWPSVPGRAALAALARPAVDGLRWTTPAQWHVTLRFLGEVDDPAPVVRAVEGVPPVLDPAPVPAELGPATAWFPGRRVLQVPVTGLDALAAAVAGALETVGPGPGGAPDRPEPFRGHVTVARVRGRGRGPVPLAGAPCAAPWPVTEVTVVRSTLGGSGSRYEVLAAVALATGADRS